MYEGRLINKLQNSIILLIFKIWKIRNIRFVRDLILNNSCEFYYDDVTVTSFVNDKYGDATAESSVSVSHFLWAKRRCPNTIHSEMRPVYGDKCFTRPEIHVWCKKFACGRESVVDEKRPGWCVVSTTDAAITAVASLTQSERRVSISVQINLDNILKNKRLMFEI